MTASYLPCAGRALAVLEPDSAGLCWAHASGTVYDILPLLATCKDSRASVGNFSNNLPPTRFLIMAPHPCKIGHSLEEFPIPFPSNHLLALAVNVLRAAEAAEAERRQFWLRAVIRRARPTFYPSKALPFPKLHFSHLVSRFSTTVSPPFDQGRI